MPGAAAEPPAEPPGQSQEAGEQPAKEETDSAAEEPAQTAQPPAQETVTEPPAAAPEEPVEAQQPSLRLSVPALPVTSQPVVSQAAPASQGLTLPPDKPQLQSVPEAPPVEAEPEPDPAPAPATVSLPVDTPPLPAAEEKGPPPVAEQPPAPAQPAAPEPSGFGSPASVAATGGSTVSVGGGVADDEQMVDIDAVLATIEGLDGGQSKGGLSWHSIALAMQCWRKAFYALVLGLAPLKFSKALQFGSLYHACWELWYRFGGAREFDEPCKAVADAGAPNLANEVRQLVYAEMKNYAAGEAAQWDIRAVEPNVVAFLPPQRIDGKTVYVPLSCRHDLIYAPKAADSACCPEGPVPDGVYIVDRKTTSALTYAATKGFAMDGQFLMNMVLFKLANEEAQFGPLRGMTFSVAAKHKSPDMDSFRRIDTGTDDAHLSEFYEGEVKPWATELYRRLNSQRAREDVTLWPKKRTACLGRGLCRYFNLCDIGGSTCLESQYRTDPSNVINIEALAVPNAKQKKELRVVKPGDKAKADARKIKAERRKQLAAQVLKVFCTAAASWPVFNHKQYLGEGKTKKEVHAQLVLNLKASWDVGTKQPSFGPDEEGLHYDLDFREKGIGWLLRPSAQMEGEDDKEYKKRLKKEGTFKGQMTWKQLAEGISIDWYSLDNLDPSSAR